MGLYLAVYLTYKVYPLIIFLRLNDKQLSGGEFIPDPTMLRNQLNFEFNLSIFASKYHYQDWDVPLNITKKNEAPCKSYYLYNRSTLWPFSATVTNW